MAKIIFFARLGEKSLLESVEFYRQDIDALKILGHEVIVCTKYREIPINYDVMFVWWWTYALLPVLLSRILKKPSIITGTFDFRFSKEFNGKDYFSRSWWERFAMRVATCCCTLNLFVNRLELESCSNYFKLSNGRYYPHIIHSDYLKGPATRRENILFNLAWSNKDNLIRKGIPELLDAVRILKDDGVEVCLKLAGHDGNGYDYLLSNIDRLNIKDEVCHLGQISRTDKINLLRTCEIYVQPSHFEGFGVAIAEAMGCGACVITCDVGGVKSVVGDAGIYISPGSSEELAKAIKLVLYDENLRHKLQKKAHERACGHFTVDKKIQLLKAYLAEVI